MRTKSFAALALGAVFALAAWQANAAIKTQTVDYKIGNDNFEGYLAYDDAAKGKRPGVVIYPAWTGISDNEREHAERLAKLGYVAFVADIYGKGIHPKPPQESGQMSGKYVNDRNLYREHAKAGLDQLTQEPDGRYQADRGDGLLLRRGRRARAGAQRRRPQGRRPVPCQQRRLADARRQQEHQGACPRAAGPGRSEHAARQDARTSRRTWTPPMSICSTSSYSGTAHCYTDAKAGSDMSHGCAYNPESEKRSWQAMSDLFKDDAALSLRAPRRHKRAAARRRPLLSLRGAQRQRLGVLKLDHHAFAGDHGAGAGVVGLLGHLVHEVVVVAGSWWKTARRFAPAASAMRIASCQVEWPQPI